MKRWNEENKRTERCATDQRIVGFSLDYAVISV